MKNVVVNLKLEQSSVGAPCPFIFSSEHNLYVVYYIQDIPLDFSLQAIGIAKFNNVYAHQFGAPNEEAFTGHPLAKYGLEPFGTFKIENSTWVDYFEKINRVHACHNKETFKELNHYIWSFHDTTLEIIAKSYDFEICDSSIQIVMNKLVNGKILDHF